MAKNFITFSLIIAAGVLTSSNAHASSSLTLLHKEKGVPVHVIEVDKEAIRNKTQSFTPAKLSPTPKKNGLKNKKAKH